MSIGKMVQNLMRKSVERGIKSEAAFYHKMLPDVDAFVRVPSAMGLAYSVIDQTSLFASVKTNSRTCLDFKSLKTAVAQIKGTQAVISLDMANKLTIEVPFNRSCAR